MSRTTYGVWLRVCCERGAAKVENETREVSLAWNSPLRENMSDPRLFDGELLWGPKITVNDSTGMAAVLPPLSVMQSWPPPNHVNPPSRGTLMLAVEIPLTAVTIVIVALRLFSRAYLTSSPKRICLDDLLIIGAVAATIAHTLLHIYSIQYGWGRHIWDVEPAWIAPAQKLVMATEVIFCLVVSTTKLSILALYLRVFSAYTTFRHLCWVGVLFCTSWMIAIVFAAVFQCAPVEAFWDLSIVPATCVNMYALVMSTSVLNSASDLYLFVLPMRWVWMLRLPRRQRVGLVVAFSLAGVACLAGIVRLHFLHRTFTGSWDATWHGAALYVTMSIEGNIGIICASIPALKPLFVRMVGGSTHASVPHHGSSSGAPCSIGGGPSERRNSVKRSEEVRCGRIRLGSLPSIDEDGDHPQRIARDEEQGDQKRHMVGVTRC